MNTANRVLDELYFISTTVVDWVDIFTCPKHKHITRPVGFTIRRQ